ncbi:MAG: penicillin acylase family protein [Bryobacteraceae bacterium]
MLTRVVRAINVCVGLVVVFIAVAVYWFVFRPLPKVSGTVSAPIESQAVVRRDARGVPHIEAGSWQDAMFLQGYVTAQDRLWQMDGLRRFGAGELAEVFGPAVLANDQRSRSMRMRSMAEGNANKLRSEDRASIVEYARGVNYFIDTHRGKYSLEFSIPGRAYDPRPWTVVDSVLVALVMFRDMTDNSHFEFDKGILLGMADPAKVRTLFPAAQGQQLLPGSNAWAVSGTHTLDGSPMVANDPHLAYRIPGTWYLAQLKAPGLNVSGATLPGLPGVVTGHNAQIAWGLTNLETDVMDLYREQMDERTGQYVFQGKAEQAHLDRQMIGVRGSKPVQLDTWVTRHGPIFIRENGKAYSLRWSATDGFDWPVYRLNRASNWAEFREALRGYWGPGMNFVYGDRAGNIGYQGTGRMPIRGGGTTPIRSDAPLDGSDGTAEWTGWIPFDQMPSIYRPSSGIVATANQNPYPANFAYQMPGGYADRYRVEQINALLRAKPKLSVDDMLAIQKDVYSAYDHFLAQRVVAAVRKRAAADADLQTAVDVLDHWNGQMEKDAAAPFITQTMHGLLGRSLVLSLAESGKNAAGAKIPDIAPRSQVIETLLRERPKGWVRNDDWDAWLVEQLRQALKAGRSEQGSPVTKWRWGNKLRWNFVHPVANGLPPLEYFFDIGPVEMSGSGTTVKQTSSTLGPSERMVVDLGNLDRSVQNLPIGESGFVGSSHYKDQWRAYYVGKSFPMGFDHVNATDVLTVRPE